MREVADESYSLVVKLFSLHSYILKGDLRHFRKDLVQTHSFFSVSDWGIRSH